MGAYKRVTNPDAPDEVWLEREDGSRFQVTGAVTDADDGITDDDFDFELGKQWAAQTEDADDDD